jgi:hypothetical protein
METNQKKVKSILFRYQLVGQGIVNFDSDDQKYTLDAYGFRKTHFNINKNNNYCKKDFYRDENGVIRYKVKISSCCMKNAMFGKDAPKENNKSSHQNETNMALLSSPWKIVKGFMQTEKGELGLKRKACISFPDAIQSCDALTYMELHTKSGFKKRKPVELELEEAKDETADPTMFNKESVGKIKYEGIGEIDMCQIEFISTDDIFDRLAIHEDDFPLFKKFSKLHIPNFNSEIGYYRMNGSVDLTPERGFVYNNDNKNHFVKYFFEKLISLKINRADAYARICKLEIKELYDPYMNTFMEEENWRELKTIDDVNNLNFDFHQFYMEANEYAPLREEMEKNYKAYQDTLKENKKNKREQAKTKKENKLKESIENSSDNSNQLL